MIRMQRASRRPSVLYAIAGASLGLSGQHERRSVIREGCQTSNLNNWSVVVIVISGKTSRLRVHDDLSSLPVLGAEHFEVPALTKDLQIRVAFAQQPFSNLILGNRL